MQSTTRFPKKAAALLFFLLSTRCLLAQSPSSGALDVYTDFLQTQQVSAKDYILNLFDRYDIVVLCERDHREITQYDLILDILRDDRFAAVGNACFEIGPTTNNEALDAFVHNRELTGEEAAAAALRIQRNSYGAALWEKANYAYYIEGVQQINRLRSPERQIHLAGLDIGVDWATATDADIRRRDSLVSEARDSILAANFIRIHAERHPSGKSLVVLNFRHAFLQDLFGRRNAGRFIAEAFPGRVANVYLNSFALRRNSETRRPEIAALADGKWDAAFLKAGKSDVGFDFADSPFGRDRLDIIPFDSDRTFAEFFTGFVYYTFFPRLRTVTGIENYIDDEFAPELMRRYGLEQQVYGNEPPTLLQLKETYNTVTDETYEENAAEFSKAIGQINRWLK